MSGDARVRVRCPQCGPRTVGLSAIELVAADAGGVNYRFGCPNCGKRVVASADRDVQRTLARNRVEVVVPSLKEELAELESQPGVQEGPTPS